MRIFIDIETIPTQQPHLIELIRQGADAERDQALARLKPPSNYSNPETIERYMETARSKLIDEHEEKIRAAIDRTAFDGTMGQIFCIAVAFNDGEPCVFNVNDLSEESEASMLDEFWSVIHLEGWRASDPDPVIIGHNHLAFDLPFLWQRSVIVNSRPPYWFPRNRRPWDDCVLDTMLEFAGAKGRISLDMLCTILGIEGKNGFSGADVWPAVQAGEWEKVFHYCADDVERTRACYKRIMFKNALE